jgi:hypothetical protein
MVRSAALAVVAAVAVVQWEEEAEEPVQPHSWLANQRVWLPGIARRSQEVVVPSW